MTKRSRQREQQKAHVRAGLCALCSEPRVTAKHCQRHREKWNAYMRAYGKRWRRLDKARRMEVAQPEKARAGD